MIEIFGEHYLREPNAEDTTRLMQMGESKGFQGMLGCIGDGRIVLQHGMGSSLDIVMTQQSFWKLLHQMICGFGMLTLWMLGSHNDLKVLQRSPLFARLTRGEVPPVNFEVNGRQYTKGYWLMVYILHGLPM